MENEGVQPESYGIPQESSRERNLSIISSYIQRQKSLLSRIRQDVDKLEAFKDDVELDCEAAFSRILLSENSGSKRSSENGQSLGLERLGGLVKDVQEAGTIGSLDWDVLKNGDTSRLMTMQKCANSDIAMPPPTPVTPSLDQSKPTLSSFVFGPRMLCLPSSKESHIQRRMRELRQQLVSPALEQAQQFFASLPPDSDEDDDETERRKTGKKMRGREAGMASGARSSANRRRIEAATTAAASRPRGFGGRFLKTKDPRTSLNQQDGNTPVNSAADGLDGSFWADTGRVKRNRRPSTRFGSPAPTVASVMSSRSATANVSRGRASRHPESSVSASPAPEANTRVRLTIRIPTLASLQKRKNKSADTHASGPSASASVSASYTPSESIDDTSVGTSAFSAPLPHNYVSRVDDASLYFSHRLSNSTPSLGHHHVHMKEEEYDEQMEVDLWDNESTANEPTRQVNSQFRYYLGGAQRSRRSSQESIDHSGGGMPLSAASSTFTGYGSSIVPPPTATSVAESVSMSVVSKALSSRHEDTASSSRSTVKKWSDEEQRCLDELLQQYPDGTKNRWSTISRAMNGARNPRQISARVQKLFNKMTGRPSNAADEQLS